LDAVEEISCFPRIERYHLLEREGGSGLKLGRSVSYQQVALVRMLAIPFGYLFVKIEIQTVALSAVHVFGDIELCRRNGLALKFF